MFYLEIPMVSIYFYRKMCFEVGQYTLILFEKQTLLLKLRLNNQSQRLVIGYIIPKPVDEN